MTNQHGSPEERQLLRRHQESLRTFLDHPDVRPANPGIKLEIGLENSLVLKFTALARRTSPFGLIHQIGEHHPSMQRLAETIIQHKLHCHAGIKLTPEQLEHEFYVYDSDTGVLQSEGFVDEQWGNCGLPQPPLFFGHSSTGTISAYAAIAATDSVELEQEMGLKLPSAGLKIKTLLHSRRMPNGEWKADKAGLEITPFPSHTLNAALGNMRLNFSYLIHRGGSRHYGVIGMKGHRQVFYTALLPKSPKKIIATPK